MKKLSFMVIIAFILSLVTSSVFAGPQDFTLVNSSASSICYVYITPSNSNDWESDVLGASECLEPGERMDITFNAGSQPMWDLRVEDNDGNYEDYDGFNLNTISTITIKGNGKASYQ